MAAPKGNRFWEARSSHGRDPIFKTPDDLWTACLEYFEWVEANPLYERKAFHASGIITTDDMPKMRAMTVVGLCNFLDIGTSTWSDYAGRKDFSAITARAEQIMRQQKFEGASADLLNPNIIARDLGLADKQEHMGRDGGPIQTQDVTAADVIAARLAAIKSRASGEPDA